MHRFFACMEDGRVILPKDELHHAKDVLRLRTGDSVQAVISEQLYAAQILDIDSGTLKLEEVLPSPEPVTRVTLFQGIPKGDKMDYIVQKCTEAGVFRIVPVQMPRCVVQLGQKDADKKQQRWQRIALESAKQSGRTHVPEIALPLPFAALNEQLSSFPLTMIPWEDARGNTVSSVLDGHPGISDLAIVIGPEGGMGEDEIRVLSQQGTPITLGRRIFRTETAGLAALIMVLFYRREYD